MSAAEGLDPGSQIPRKIPAMAAANCIIALRTRTIMKPLRCRIPGLLVVVSVPALAVTDTWDGGGADNNVGADANWVDNNDPASNLSFTDLIFGSPAATSKNVVFDTAFS